MVPASLGSSGAWVTLGGPQPRCTRHVGQASISGERTPPTQDAQPGCWLPRVPGTQSLHQQLLEELQTRPAPHHLLQVCHTLHRKPAPPFHPLLICTRASSWPRVLNTDGVRGTDLPATSHHGLSCWPALTNNRTSPECPLPPYPCQPSNRHQTEHLHRRQSREEEGTEKMDGHCEVTWRPPRVR